jgi:hypothetical protein
MVVGVTTIGDCEGGEQDDRAEIPPLPTTPGGSTGVWNKAVRIKYAYEFS